MRRGKTLATLVLKTFAVAGAIVLGGCYHTNSHRTSYVAAGADCEPTASGDVGELCERAIFERASVDRYELHFVEFDDQGWVFSVAEDQGGKIIHPLELLTDRLRAELEDSCSDPIALVIYVHGWKHNAASSDSNVKRFRALLRGVARVEKATGDNRKVIGVYVGWRGQSLDLPEPFTNLTFWERKNTAEQVAQGTVRELYARVTALADIANQPWTASTALQRSGQATLPALSIPVCKIKPVKALFIGHSFGGHVLVTSLSNLVLRNLVTMQEELRARDQERAQGGKTAVQARASAAREQLLLRREGDMILLINPAVEGARFEPLHRVAHQGLDANDPRYRAPLLVSITSTADSATRLAFPLGRTFSTLFEQYNDSIYEIERNANLHTLGHNGRYLTHRIDTVSQSPDQCADWRSEDPLHQRVEAEVKHHRAFIAQLRDSEKAKSLMQRRWFCGDLELVYIGSTGTNPFSPIMNIQVNEELIKNHSDITGDRLLTFVRQLYLDSSERAISSMR